MKKKILVKGPAFSLSGYGEQTRFALRALRQHEDKFEIFLENISWGRTGHLIDESEEKAWMNVLVMKTVQFSQQKGEYDISLQVTIPNEFQKLAPVNIGYTAGIETTKVSPHWIEKAKLMDKIIVVSNHSKDVYNSTEYKLKNEQTGEIIDFKNTTPIEVVHFPVKIIEPKELNLDLKTNFNFLSVAQWGPRKNIEATIVSFLKEFKNDSDVGLVLKINFAKNCIADKIACETKVSSIKKNFPDSKCKIYLLHGNMSEEEMQSLYTHPKIKALISTTHGEGFGLPLFEAVCNGLPVIAPKWSGHVDFLLAPVKEDGKTRMRNHFVSIDFDLGVVNKEAVWEGVIQADSQWCFVKEHSTMDGMRKVIKNHQSALSAAKKLKEHILQEFKEEKQIQKFLTNFGVSLKNKNSNQITGISFCIPTNGKRIEKTIKTIKSIKAQNWNNVQHEVILCGKIEDFKNIKDIILIDKTEEAESRKVASLRNSAASKSKFENIVWCDDDVIFDKSWLDNLIKYSNNNSWNVLGNKVLNPDGTRYWDRAILNPHCMVSYEHSENDTRLYQSSAFIMVRREVFDTVKWDETKLVHSDKEGQIPEDVQYSFDLTKNDYRISFNSSSLVWHNDDSYMGINENNAYQPFVCLKKELITKLYNIEFFPPHKKEFKELLREFT
jgi:glycosyltransferase involved in cell wall biosynthesis